jgi:hypothetical protein
MQPCKQSADIANDLPHAPEARPQEIAGLSLPGRVFAVHSKFVYQNHLALYGISV